MTKKELIETLQKLDIPFNEAILSDDDVDSFEHINCWDYVWTPLPASSSSYSFTVTYQISFISGKPRSEKLLELIKLLLEQNYPVQVYHEYIAKNRHWHSYFSLDVLEDIINV